MSNLFILLVPWNLHSIKFLSNSNQGSYKCTIISLFNFNFNFIALVSFFRKVWDKSDPCGTWEHGGKNGEKTRMQQRTDHQHVQFFRNASKLHIAAASFMRQLASCWVAWYYTTLLRWKIKCLGNELFFFKDRQ